MKMTLHEVITRSRILAAIPHGPLSPLARRIVVMNELECAPHVEAYEKARKEALDRIKPENFDEQCGKFAELLRERPADAQSEEEKKRLAELRADPEWEAFQETDRKLAKELNDICAELITRECEVREHVITDEVLDSIAVALPSDGAVPVNGMPVPNDEVYYYIARLADQMQKTAAGEAPSDQNTQK